MSDSPQLPKFLRAREVAEWLGISEQALAQDRFRGDGIPYVRIGSRVRYRMADLVEYVEKNTVIPGTQTPVVPTELAKQPARVHPAKRR